MARTLCVWFPEWARDSGQSDDPAGFDSIVERIEAVVPRVEVAEPGLVFLPVAGALRFYGGERELVEVVAETVGPQARLGLADGPFAARWAAAASPTPLVVEDTAEFLTGLEVETLGLEELAATLRWLGITTLGELARLPPEAMASRFGMAGITAHRLATGTDRDLHPRRIPSDLTVSSDHAEDPLISVDQVVFVGRQLAIRFLEVIAPSLCYQATVVIETEAGEARQRAWRSLDPFTDQSLSERILWQLGAWLDRLEGGVVTIRIEAGELSDSGRQLSLADGWSMGISDESGRVLSRIQSLLGAEAVLQSQRRGGRLPSQQVEWLRWGEGPVSAPDGEPFPGETPPPSPALVTGDPPPIELEWEGGIPSRIRLGTRWEPVLSWSGPWRMMGHWWLGEPTVDRYQIVTSAGAVLCVVSGGRTYLAGVYD